MNIKEDVLHTKNQFNYLLLVGDLDRRGKIEDITYGNFIMIVLFWFGSLDRSEQKEKQQRFV